MLEIHGFEKLTKEEQIKMLKYIEKYEVLIIPKIENKKNKINPTVLFKWLFLIIGVLITLFMPTETNVLLLTVFCFMMSNYFSLNERIDNINNG